ncbi:MAG: DUF3052 domain-containing protein [Fimbriimonadaceae bacterium]
MSVGYSGKPPYAKLGLAEGAVVAVVGFEGDYSALVQAPFPVTAAGGPPWQFVHLFVRSRAELQAWVTGTDNEITPDGVLWVSWPKRSSAVSSDVDENVLRECALPIGLVDIKVCAIDSVWSALKFVVRKELRPCWGP